jgi:hypothetical protein
VAHEVLDRHLALGGNGVDDALARARLDALHADLQLAERGNVLRDGVRWKEAPSSYSVMAATVTIGFVIDASRKIASGVIGAPAALSRKPTASR